MASYLDQPYQFAPFVQTVPVESMVKVGMIKQQQYDAGVQKVKDYVETLSSLNVSNHPGIIQYLNKTMENLKTQLKPLAGADFSDQELLNNVGALARQIYRDPIIQNGVRSAARIKENYELMDQSIKENKSSPDNEADFYGTLNNWYNNPDLATPFSGRYYQYTDYSKQWLEALSKLHPNEKLRQIPFTTFLDPTTGQILETNKLAAVMTEVGIKGISPGDIENAIRATMTPQIVNQLGIESRVRMQGVDVPKLEQYATKKYESARLSLEQQKEAIEKEMKSLVSKPKEYALAKQYLSSLEEQLGDATKPNSLLYKYENELKSIRENPDAAKREIYTNGAITQFAEAFKWREQSTKYVKSPFTEYQQWQAEFNLNTKKYNLDLAKFDFDKGYKNALLKLKAMGISTGDGEDGEELDVPAFLSGLYKFTQTASFGENMNWLGYHGESADNSIRAAQDETNLLMKKLGLTREQVLTKLVLYRYGTPETKGKGKIDEIPVNLRDAADRFWKYTTDAGQTQGIIDGVNQKVRSKYSAWKPYIVKDAQGNEVKFTPDEIITFNNKARYVMGPRGSMTAPTWDPDKLTEKEKILAKNAIGPEWATYSRGLQENEENISKEISKELREVYAVPDPTYTMIPTPNQKSQLTMAGIAEGLMSVPGQKGGSALIEGTFPSDIQKNAKDYTYFLYQDGVTSALAIRKGGKNEAVIQIGPKSAATLPFMKVYGTDPYLYEATRNIGLGQGTSQDLFMPSDFRNLSNLIAKAELTESSSGLQKYLIIKLDTPLGEIPITLKLPIDIPSAREYVTTITDDGLAANILQYGESVPDEVKSYLQQFIKK